MDRLLIYISWGPCFSTAILFGPMHVDHCAGGFLARCASKPA